MLDLKTGFLSMKLKKNNSERPVDALAEKHPSLTDNLKSRDASASKTSSSRILLLGFIKTRFLQIAETLVMGKPALL